MSRVVTTSESRRMRGNRREESGETGREGREEEPVRAEMERAVRRVKESPTHDDWKEMCMCVRTRVCTHACVHTQA